MNWVEIITSVFSSAVAAGTCLLIASEGGILNENAGVLNLGFEGMMLMGAVTGFLAVQATGSLIAALAVAILVGGALAFIHAFLTVTLRVSQVVSGLSITILGTGLSAFLGTNHIGQIPRAYFDAVAIPGLSEIPIIGPSFFNQNVIVYFSYFLVPALWFFLTKTRWGMQVRAVGHNPAAADAAGINVHLIRYSCTIVSGMLIGIAGMYLSLAYNSSWLDNMAGGKGWIAVALVIFATWNPLKAPIGAYLFGAVAVLGLRLQAFGIDIPTTVFNMLPYVTTVVVLILTTGSFRKNVPLAPAALGVAYDREAR